MTGCLQNRASVTALCPHLHASCQLVRRSHSLQNPASCSECCADIHDAYTTVHEALLFSARLRINNSPSKDEVEQFVEEVRPAAYDVKANWHASCLCEGQHVQERTAAHP